MSSISAPRSRIARSGSGTASTASSWPVYAGAMGVTNGIDQLVDAAVALREVGEDGVAIVAAGNGTEKDRIEQRVAELGLENMIVLPDIPRDEIPLLVGAADVTLTAFAPIRSSRRTRRTSSSTRWRQEAPIVNLDGWLHRLVEENQVGVYVPPGDGKALAETLTDLAGKPELVRSWAVTPARWRSGNSRATCSPIGSPTRARGRRRRLQPHLVTGEREPIAAGGRLRPALGRPLARAGTRPRRCPRDRHRLRPERLRPALPLPRREAPDHARRTTSARSRSCATRPAPGARSSFRARRERPLRRAALGRGARAG